MARRRRLSIRSSGDVLSETPATETESEKSIDETPKGPPSLISALNVERALRGIPITDVDHYGRLGLQKGCSYEQVTVAYRNKVDQLLNQGLDEAELSNKMDLLKESYSILSSVEERSSGSYFNKLHRALKIFEPPLERRLYDWSLARSEKPDRYAWPFEEDITLTPTEDPPPEEPEDVGPTRLVGYFMLGWLILSVVLSIALAR
ncbi:NADH dehydrogenase-like complex U, CHLORORESPIRATORY REDUCTION L [Hibiscus trionum]|uniref:NADH dehydrogenase-like complex U, CHLORORESPIRATORY REDUCTION L n=1 Tax=Hibiscus trionum TaxID=183268 RepID=A0A9W7ICA6_HIBTR|nr:NADH dehydrogenase-like complex U, CHLORORESPIRATORY REDUCTION L [Hibiscus trionum]